MANTKLYRKSVTFLLAQKEAIADPNAPKSSELNTAVDTLAEIGNDTLVYNITCALVEDGTTFELGDPDTDETLTFCDEANYSEPTIDNPSVVFEFLEDADPTATGQFNLARALLSFPGLTYYVILRVGPDSNEAFAPNQVVNIVRVQTDYAVEVKDSGSPVRLTQNFLNDGFSHPDWNYRLAA